MKSVQNINCFKTKFKCSVSIETTIEKTIVELPTFLEFATPLCFYTEYIYLIMNSLDIVLRWQDGKNARMLHETQTQNFPLKHELF